MMVMMLMVNGDDDGASRGKDNLTNPTWQPSIGPVHHAGVTWLKHIWHVSLSGNRKSDQRRTRRYNDIGRRYAL
jgi:hypothetical protein